MNRADSLTAADPARVELLCDAERWADALPLISRLLAGEPENDVAWCLLAQCHLGLGRPEPALTAARSAAALAPENEWPHRLISFAATNLGRHDEAVRAARESVRLEPQAWQTHVRLAAAVTRRDAGLSRRARRARARTTPDEAVAAADRALALAPDEPQVQLIHGSVAAGHGRPAEAERAYRAALALDPQSSGAHHLLAALQLRHHRGPTGLADAATGFVTALNVDPTAQVSRRSLELTLRVFLGRVAYGLFVVAYLSQLFALGDAVWARAVPVVMLFLPALFVAGFQQRLSPQLRSYLRRLLSRGAIAVAVGLELTSVVLMLIGAVAAPPGRPYLAIGAAAVALIARLTLHLDTRRLLRAPGTARASR